jgi:cystathionine gamma-lyase
MGASSKLSYGNGFEYSRTCNPTRAAFEQAVAGAEGAKYCLAFGSGMAATASIIHLLKSGDHVISIDDVYGGTQRYFRRTAAPSYGIEFDFMDLSDPDALAAAWKPNTKMVWLETPTNPTLKITDIEAVAKVVHAKGGLLVVDNTFMSPYFQTPLSLGADIVMASVTKYLNGHSDVVMGIAACNDDELNTKLRFIQNGVGAVPGPHDSYMALRGLKTLHVRMQRHGENAQAVAEHLEAHPAVDKVLYPGLPSHPQHELAKRQCHNGFSGMVSIYVKGGAAQAIRFTERLQVFTLAESLGAVESLAQIPASMTHASVPAEMREKLGISDNLVRLSVGIEHIDDLIADLDQALAASQEI